MDISIVVPVYGCPEALIPLHDRLTKTIKKLKKSYEIVFVNDGCPKNSWEIIEKICKKDRKTVGINLSRNFGQIHSTNAGISYASGDYVVLMDCDLQDKPEGIENLFNEINKGYDIVFAKRINRKDSAITKLFSKIFYRIYNSLIDGNYDGDICNYCIVRRKVVDEYLKINDNNKSFTVTLSWMGFKSSVIEMDSDERFEGKSSYTFRKKIDLAIDLLTSQSNKPLKLVVYLGSIIAFISFIFLFIQIIKYYVSDVPAGWTSIIASIFFMGGLMLLCLGGIGIYVGNIFNQTKGKPEYLIDEILNPSKK